MLAVDVCAVVFRGGRGPGPCMRGHGGPAPITTVMKQRGFILSKPEL